MEIKNLVTFGYAEKEKIAKREQEQAQNAWEKWKCVAEVFRKKLVMQLRSRKNKRQ